jgi:hypothetical protein
MTVSRWYAVDRLEGDRVVLIADDGERIELPSRSLPFRAQDGMVVRVDLIDQRGPDWAHAERDEAEERRRMEEARRRLERLKRRDPGGDVRL